jgi:hypothetical protein
VISVPVLNVSSVVAGNEPNGSLVCPGLVTVFADVAVLVIELVVALVVSLVALAVVLVLVLVVLAVVLVLELVVALALVLAVVLVVALVAALAALFVATVAVFGRAAIIVSTSVDVSVIVPVSIAVSADGVNRAVEGTEEHVEHGSMTKSALVLVPTRSSGGPCSQL